MTTYFRFDLECRKPGTRTWEETSHSTSRWECVPQLLEEQTRAHPELQWRIVGELVEADEDGKTVTKKA